MNTRYRDPPAALLIYAAFALLLVRAMLRHRKDIAFMFTSEMNITLFRHFAAHAVGFCCMTCRHPLLLDSSQRRY